MRKFIYRYIEDILLIIGALIIIAATFLLSFVAALYVTGMFLLLAGVFFTRHPPNDGRRR